MTTTLLAFRAHVTTAAGHSLRIGVLASGRTQADALIDQALPEHHGAQIRCIRPKLISGVTTQLYPTGSRYRAPAANQPLQLA